MNRVDAERLLIQRFLRKKQEVKRSYFKFFEYFWPTVSAEKLKLCWHHEYICDELQKVAERIFDRQDKLHDAYIFNLPPGETKSTMVSQLWNAWMWVNDPTVRVISASHSKNLSLKNSLATRNCVRSDRFQEMFKLGFKPDQDSMTYFVNEHGGDRLSVSVGAKAVGNHAHVLIYDDLVDPSKITPKSIEAANTYVNETMAQRKVNEAITPEVLVMQRVSENDPTANLLKKRERVHHVCFPASDDFPVLPEKCRKYYVNGLLNPERKDRMELERAKVRLGIRGFAGQYGQQPRDPSGNIVKRDWMVVKDDSEVPDKVRTKVKHFVIDTAYTEERENCPSAMLSYCVHRNTLYITGFMKAWKTFGDLQTTIRTYVKYEGSLTDSKIYIEPKASGLSIYQDIKKNFGLNVIKYKMPDGDKVTRIRSCEPELESLRVVLIKGPWNEEFIEDCCMFPNGTGTEAVDLLSMAITLGLKRSQDQWTGEADYGTI